MIIFHLKEMIVRKEGDGANGTAAICMIVIAVVVPLLTVFYAFRATYDGNWEFVFQMDF